MSPLHSLIDRLSRRRSYSNRRIVVAMLLNRASAFAKTLPGSNFPELFRLPAWTPRKDLYSLLDCRNRINMK